MEEERKAKEAEEAEAKAKVSDVINVYFSVGISTCLCTLFCIQAAKAKEEQNAIKKAFKSERKTLRAKTQVSLSLIPVFDLSSLTFWVAYSQEYEYFASDETERLKHMTDLDVIASKLSLLQLEDINKALTSGDADAAKHGFLKGVRLVQPCF